MSPRKDFWGPPATFLSVARWPLLGGLVGAAALLAHPGSALAADPGPDTLPIHIVAIQTEDADDQAEGLTKALRSAIRAMPGWSLGEGDNSLEVLVLKLQCTEPPDVSCQSRIADVIKSDRYVWGIVGKKGDSISGDLNYWVRGQGTSKYHLEYPANLTEPNDEALKKVAMDAISGLTGGPPKGQLHVKAGNVNGQVFVDGAPIGALTNGEGTFSLAAGQHKVTVKAAGYNDAETTTVVKPTSTVDVALNPQVINESKPVDFRRVGGFIGLGAGAVLVGLGVVSSLQVNDVQSQMGNSRTDDKPRADVESGNLCSGRYVSIKEGKEVATPPDALELCNKAKVFEPLQFVFYALGAAVGGTGLYLLATSGTTAPPAAKTARGWTFVPSAGPQGGGIEARYRF
jgi:hypothetical protein